ncbi:MAG: arylsulfatase B [Chlamydiales bacterium]|jgi:arylsulfatase B
MISNRLLPLVFAALVAPVAALASGVDQVRPNILMIVADDVGVDRIGAYGEHPDAGQTPSIDRLAARGILFRNAWSNPSCSPTRAAILTGRHGFRTGIGKPIAASVLAGSFRGLRLSETTLPEMLGAGYQSIALGKWHLSTESDGLDHPQRSGFQSYAGAMRNLFGDADVGIGDERFDYFRWQKTTDGNTVISETYTTTDTVNDALAAVDTLVEPWFIYLAFNASHKPLHVPPDHLHGFDLSGVPLANPVPHMKAMTEAMDREIGRLLAGVDFQDTTVMFLGDNGTGGFAMDAPFDPTQGKGSLYESGINVPFIIAGSGVAQAGRECAALVGVTDLFATMGELAGQPTDTARDSVSLVPYMLDPGRHSQRKYVYSEKFRPNGLGPYTAHIQAVRGRRYKLIWRPLGGTPQFFDLDMDPFEQNDLMLQRRTPAEQRALVELKAALIRLTAD